jgi:hypothetical protein
MYSQKVAKGGAVILSKAKNLIISTHFRSFTSFRMTNQDFLQIHQYRRSLRDLQIEKMFESI